MIYPARPRRVACAAPPTFKSRGKALRLCALLCAALVCAALQRGAPPASAAGAIVVNSTADGAPANDGRCTLREAIANANNDNQSGSTDCAAGSGADTITFNVPTTDPGYNATADAYTITLTVGELAINSSMTINGLGANRLTVKRSAASGTPNFRVFTVVGPSPSPVAATVTISGLTVSNGNAVVSGVTNGLGGGIYNNASLTLKNVTVSGNAAAGGGGGISNFGQLNLTNVTLSGNTAGGGGGGIFNDFGFVTAANSTVSGNTANGEGGGGLNNDAGFMTLTNVTLSGNTANNSGGGGLFNWGVFNPGSATLINSTVSGNTASGDGGGISNGQSRVTLSNTIVADNKTTAGTGPDLSGSFYGSQDYNLIGNTSGITFSGTTTHNIVNQSANLGPLTDNGGPTKTMMPLPSSPAVNAGDPANLPQDSSDLDGDGNTTEPLPIDQRGFARVVGGKFDIGAVETNYSITATAGTPQSALVNTAFATRLQATVKESGNRQVGIPVTFIPPSSGPSGTFSGSPTVNTDASGVATAPTFTADGIAGGPYNVVASLGGNSPSANFALTNAADPRAATTTALASSPNPSDPGQAVTFTATVTSASGTPTGTVQFKSDGANLGSPAALNAGGAASLTTSALAAGAHAITAAYGGDTNFQPSAGTLSGGQLVGSIIEFTQPIYIVGERGGSISVTVKRTGVTSRAASVDYATDDGSTPSVAVPCSAVTGIALERCDYTRAAGTLQFAANETEKTFTVLVNDDSYREGTEALSLRLSNPSGQAVLGQQSSATLQITDDTLQTANPVDDTQFFVVQHYHDFLGREPDAAGLQFWTNEIEKCGADSQCREAKRVNVSAAFFLSIEFQQTGFFAYRVRKAAFGEISPPNVPAPVRLNAFLLDTQRIGQGVVVGQGAWQQQLESNKNAFALDFVQRADFLARYPGSTSASAFVGALNTNAGNTLTDADRAALVSELSPNPADATLRADVLRKVAENSSFAQAEFRRAFVLMQYFGYLRRDPDSAPDANFSGYNFWLQKLNQFGGDFVRAEMVKAFINSAEYRGRFGQ